ncbi:hypothetical protein ACOME3_006435 [Neoechinorhynchus agilis]
MSFIGLVKTKRNTVTQEYELSKESLGYGINGKVLKCKRISDGKQFAVKILRDSPKARREIDLHSRAAKDSQYIVGIEDVFENLHGKERCLLMIMECMTGGELFTRIQSRGENPFTEREAARIVRIICGAVQHLHSMNIAHRDLKPENLLYTTNDEDAQLKLTDFGFAKEVLGDKPLQTPCYTPYYAAPEILSRKQYDKSCDLWSIGVITYILLCGYPPFYSYHGATISPGMKKRIRCGDYSFPNNEWANISQQAKDLISNLLKPKPEERMSTEELLANPWISDCAVVPKTPLPTVKILKDEDNLAEIQAEINDALMTMRPESENITIKSIGDTTNNKILARRSNKLHNVTADI